MYLFIIRLVLVHIAERKKLAMKAKVAGRSGFTLVEIMIVVAIIGLLGAIAVPNFVKARTTSQLDACLNNLRQIDGAAQTLALENNKQPTDTYQLDDVRPYLRSQMTPRCPAGGNYTGPDGGSLVFGQAPACNIFGHVLP